MSTKPYVNTKQVQKELKNLGQRVKKVAVEAVQTAINKEAAFTMSFDDVEALPWLQNGTGYLVVSGTSSATVEAAALEHTFAAVQIMEQSLKEGLKEALERSGFA